MSSEAPHRMSPRHLHLPLPPGTPLSGRRSVDRSSLSPRTSAPVVPSLSASPMASSSRGRISVPALPRPPTSRFSTRRTRVGTEEKDEATLNRSKDEDVKVPSSFAFGLSTTPLKAVTTPNVHHSSAVKRNDSVHSTPHLRDMPESAASVETVPSLPTLESTSITTPLKPTAEGASQTEQALPAGWVLLYTDDAVPYYLYEPDGTTQWERPEVSSEAVPPSASSVVEDIVDVTAPSIETAPVETETEQDALPDGWVQCFTTDDPPMPYYLYEPDGTTQWERPQPVSSSVGQEEGVPAVAPDNNVLEQEENEAVAATLEEETADPVEPHDEVDETLPEGWVQQFTVDNELYYLYAPDGTTQWERPIAPAPEATTDLAAGAESADAVPTLPVENAIEAPPMAEAPLPAGWLALRTEEDETYYVYEPDGTTQWDRPTAPSSDPNPPSEIIPESAAPTEEPEYVIAPDVGYAAEQHDLLPEGWVQQFTEENEPYYLYEPDRTTQWERPTVTSASLVEEVPSVPSEPDIVSPEATEPIATFAGIESEGEDALPGGWVQQFTEENEPYYLFEPDRTTQWERPTAAVVVPDEVNDFAATETEEGAPEAPAALEEDVMNNHDALLETNNLDEAVLLPEGWAQQFTEDNEPYYLYEPNGTTQWERPLVASALMTGEANDLALTEPEEFAPEAPVAVDNVAISKDALETGDPDTAEILPEGWVKEFTEDNEPYYVYEPDGTTQWERPTECESLTVSPRPDDVMWSTEDGASPDEILQENEEPEPEYVVAPDECAVADDALDAPAVPKDVQTTTIELSLPEGWVELLTENNEPYYVYEPDGTTQWERPTESKSMAESPRADDVMRSTEGDAPQGETMLANEEPEPEYVVAPDECAVADSVLDAPAVPTDGQTTTIEQSLPEGWVELLTENNETYYFYEPDGTTQWDRPQSSNPIVVSVGESAEQDNGEVGVVPNDAVEGTSGSEQVYPNQELIMPHPQSNDTPEEINATDLYPSEENASCLELPDGWIELWTDENVPYYLYEPDGSTQWERPASAVQSKMNGENENHMHSLDDPSAGLVPPELDAVVGDVNAGSMDELVDDDDVNDFEIVDGEDDVYNYVAVLPPGWKEGFDDAAGKPFYYSEIDGTIEWVRPAIDKDENGLMETVDDRVATSNISQAGAGSSECDIGPALSLGPLPSGWVELVDESTGMPYYVNEVDGATSWERPTALQPELAGNDVSDKIPSLVQNGEPLSHAVDSVPALAPEDSALADGTEDMQSSLPPGWVEVYDEDAGMPYFYNEVNDVVTWERPRDENVHINAIDSVFDSTVESLNNAGSKDEVAATSNDGNLPPGWSKVVDDSSGQVYFYCEVDGSTSWDPPPQASLRNDGDTDVYGCNSAVDSSASPETTGQDVLRSLPPGWKELSDSDTGQVYYFNESSGVSSWKFPCEEIVGNGVDVDKYQLPDAELRSRVKNSAQMASQSRHCIGRPAHAAASFGFGGRLCQRQSIGPSGIDVVMIRHLHSVTPNEVLVKIERSKQQHGIVGPFNASNDDSVSAYVKYKASHYDDLLWSLVSTASVSQGKLRSNSGVFDSSSPEAFIVRLLLQDEALERSNVGDEKVSQAQGDVNDEFTIRTVETLLLEGQKEKAVTEAVVGKQFALALIIARCCGHEVYARAVQSFVDHALPGRRPLHTISLLLSGQLLPSGNGLTLPWDGISHAELATTWKNHLSAILSNRTEEWRQLALSLGDRLYECGEVIFAHFCYMVGGSSVGNAVSNAKMVLLGCDFGPWDVVLASDESVVAFERTEAYEWAKRRGNSLATIHSLQALKVVYAMLLADFGYLDAAKLYVDSVLRCMDVSLEQMRTFESDDGLLSLAIMRAEQNGVLAFLNRFESRLSGSIRPAAIKISHEYSLFAVPVDTSMENDDANASFLTARTTFNDMSLAPEGPKRPDVALMKENTGQQSPPPSRSAVVVPLQPIDEGNSRAECETPVDNSKQNNVFTPAKSISSGVEVNLPPSVDLIEKSASRVPSASPGVGADNGSKKASLPKLEVAPSSAPANLQSSAKKPVPSAPASKKKGFLNFGIKEKVTKWLNPDATTADLGDGLGEAYYDDKIKRWVFPGDNLEELAKPLAPPPTVLPTTPQTEERNSGTGEVKDPLAAMMAPPQRGPSALSRSRGAAPSIRPSPASMPILFPPGMSMPGGADSATAPMPSFSVFTPPPAAAPLVASDDAQEQNPASE